MTFPTDPPEHVDGPGELAAGPEQIGAAANEQPTAPLPSDAAPPAAPAPVSSGPDPGVDEPGGHGEPSTTSGPASEKPSTEGAAGGDLYTSGEKVRSLLDLVFETPPPDARTAAAVQAIKTAHRFRLTRPVVDVFPPLDDAQAWDEWLAVAVGVALNLVSDGVELDVDGVRAAGAEILARLFADVDEGGARGAGR